MDNKVNYTMVGLFVTVLAAALVAIFIWMENLNKHQDLVMYEVHMKESVAGLIPKAQVTFNGVKVGTVQSIRLSPSDPQQVDLLLSVQAGTPINQSTVAVLKSQGITGITYVGLSASRKDAPALSVKAGQKYPVIPSKPSLLETLSDAIESVTKNIKELTVSVEKIVDQKNRKAISDSLANVEKITNNLAANEKRFNDIIISTQSLTKNLAKSSRHLPDTMKELNEMMVSLQKMADNIANTSETVDHTMVGAKGLMQNVSQQVVPRTSAMLQAINQTIRQINQLSAKLEKNPSMLLRGKNPSPLGPGEK